MSVSYHPFHGKSVSDDWLAVLTEAEREDVKFTLDSGHRTMLEQQRLVREKGIWSPSNPHGAAVPTANAPHIRVGRQDHALDVLNDGGQQRLAFWLACKGVPVSFTVPPEPWHMEANSADSLHHYADALRKSSATLKVGSRGSRVWLFTHRLAVAGYLRHSGLYFSFHVGEVVRLFQRQHGLIVSGLVGPATWAKVKAVAEAKKR